MAAAIHWSGELCRNPLDIVEEIVGGYDWSFERFSDEELLAGCSGQWCDYSLHFSWRDDLSAMHLASTIDLRFPAARRGSVYELLAVINSKLWLGHFDLAADASLPVFRHAVLFRGSRGATVEQLEDLVDIAVAECERFYPAFQYVAWAGKDPDEAVAAALIETVGEA